MDNSNLPIELFQIILDHSEFPEKTSLTQLCKGLHNSLRVYDKYYHDYLKFKQIFKIVQKKEFKELKTDKDLYMVPEVLECEKYIVSDESNNYYYIHDYRYYNGFDNIENKHKGYMYRIENLESYFLSKYLENMYDINEETDYVKYYDINLNVIREFPEDLIIPLLKDNFESRSNAMSYVGIELTKYLYNKWNKKDTSPQIKERIGIIKDHIIYIANLTQEEYDDVMNNPHNPKYRSDRYLYYTYWLYVYYPLLKNGEELIMKLVNIVYLDDAQDLLMYGIYQMKPDRLYPFMKKFVIALENINKTKRRGCFDMFSSGSGAIQQFNRIVKKLHENKYDLLNDEDLEDILRNNIEY